MRELTKSMLSFSWVMPLFGMKQMLDIAMPRDPSRPFGHVTDSFETVTRATQDQLGGAWNSAFRAGDQLQRGMVDLMFSFFSLDAWNPNRMMRMSSDMMQRSMGAAQSAWPGAGSSCYGQGAGQGYGQGSGQSAGTSSAAQGAWPGTGQTAAGWPGTGEGAGATAQSTMQSVLDTATQATGAAVDAMASAATPPAGWRVTTPRGF